MKWLTILFTLFIIRVIVWANTGTMPFLIKVIYDFPGADKVGHFVLFGILSYLINWTACSLLKRTPTRIILTVSLPLFLLVGLEEWSQQFFPSRTASLLDLVFSYAGMLCGTWFAWRSRREKSVSV